MQRSQALSIKLLRPPACQIKECLQKSRVLPITWTACLSGEMMLRDVEDAWVHVVLLGLTVAMVTADVEGAMVATVLLVSACFSPGLCLSIVLVTHRFRDGKTVWVKQTLINRMYLNETVLTSGELNCLSAAKALTILTIVVSLNRTP